MATTQPKMATTQPKMAEITNKKGSSFVASAPSLEGEEPEVNSINFRESLRFFQEQLLINAKKPAANGSALKNVLRVNSSLSSTESLDIQKCSNIADEETITYTSSKIPPIPTVDTILESVRILRAIQKSQAQRGSHFGIDIISPSTDAFDSYKALELEFQKGLIQVDSLSALINGNEYSNNAETADRCEREVVIPPLLDQRSEGTTDCTDSKETSEKGGRLIQLDNFESTEIENELENTNSTTHLPNGDLPVDNGNVSDEIFDKLGVSNGILSKIDVTHQEAITEISKNLTRSNIDEEGIEDFLSCSSLTLQEESGEAKLELPNSERSTSAEFDSGMCTDKSVGSLSPIRGEMDPEKDIWSESSHYASAEGSPCESLVGNPEEQELPSNRMDDAVAMKDKPDTAVSEDESVSSQKKESTSFSKKDHDSLLSKENLSDYELKKCSISPLQLPCHMQSITSENSGNIVKQDTLQDDYHVSKDRLIEIVEDKLECLEREAIGKCTENDSLDTTENVCHPTKDTLEEFGVNLQEDKSNVCDTKIATSLEHEALNKTENLDTNVEENNQPKCTNQNNVDNSITSDISLQHSLSSGQNEAPEDTLPAENVEESVCVSVLECTFSSSELSVNTLESVEDNEVDDEPQRQKKKLTMSWDPIPLLEHMYNIKQPYVPEGLMDYGQSAECYMTIEPFGSFDNQGGKFYTAVEKNNLYFYESEQKKKLLLEVPLQYASVESIDKNVLLLDNKLGRCIKIKFTDEKDMIERKTVLQSHCRYVQSSNFLEPVNYPLKSHKDVVIIDLGSSSTRAGILMDQPTLPKLFFPTVCATDKKTGIQNYGIKALLPEIRRNSVLSFPVRPSAKVTKFTMDIDSLAGLFKTIFTDLKVDPKNYTLLICVPRSLSTSTQIALMKLLLEDLGVQSVSLTRQALLTLYANNTSTAIVVDIGDRMEVLPVADGFILEGGVSRLPYGGQRIIHHMKHALAQKHISLTSDVESFVVQYIFESLCYIAESYEDELTNAMSHPETIRKSIPLHPFFKDDTKLQTVWLDVSRFQVPEGLFKPDLWGLDSPGLHKLVHQAIQTSSMDVRRQMAENIYVSGGVTLLPGFVERLQKEVAKLTLPRLKPKVHASPYRYHMTYIGACQLASSDAFRQVCVNANEWKKNGPSSINKWRL